MGRFCSIWVDFVPSPYWPCLPQFGQVANDKVQNISLVTWSREMPVTRRQSWYFSTGPGFEHQPVSLQPNNAQAACPHHYTRKVKPHHNL